MLNDIRKMKMFGSSRLAKKTFNEANVIDLVIFHRGLQKYKMSNRSANRYQLIPQPTTT